MSSPATIAETSDSADSANTLLILPDGSPLWTAPKSDDQDETASPKSTTAHTECGELTTFPAKKKPAPIVWQIDELKAFTDMLVNSTVGRTIPILITAPGRSSYDLFHPRTKGHNALVDWDTYALEHNLQIGIRFSLVECGTMFLGSSDPGATTVELWFATDEDFANRGNPINCSSGDWPGIFRRLGFDARGWHSGWSVVQNVENGRVRNCVTGSARPTSITVGDFVDLELVTTEYPLSS